MLQPQLRRSYQELQQAIEQLLHTVVADRSDVLSIKQNFTVVQQIFQQLLVDTGDELSQESVAPRSQAIQTEIHRLLKLVEIDMMFLQASRKSTTAASRITSVSDRLKTIIGFCQAIEESSVECEC